MPGLPLNEHWSPELRRALIKVRPEFFTWSAEDRERYGVAIPEEDRDLLDQAILSDRLGIKTRASKTKKGKLPMDEQNRLNEIILPLTGIGEDSFYLSEWFEEGKTIRSFSTLNDYDKYDHDYQEEARKREDATYVKRPYRGALYLSWARLFIDNTFTYATLSMTAGYLYSSLQEASDEYVNDCIPHQYVPGKNHGKKEGDCWQWDFRVEAGGQEGLLEELQLQSLRYTNSRYDELLNHWNSDHPTGVYMIDVSVPSESNIHFVFTNKEALAEVRFRTYLRDCRAIERPANELDQPLKEEKAKLQDFISQKHRELLRTFDPTLSRIRKKRKIMMHKDALDGFE
jgi:hypothetical protein